MSGHVLPSRNGRCIFSPLSNICSTSVHNVSDSAGLIGEPSGPWSAKSMIWCESGIVPRLAFTRSKVSLPREESEASGVRKSLPVGKDEDAEAVMGSANE